MTDRSTILTELSELGESMERDMDRAALALLQPADEGIPRLFLLARLERDRRGNEVARIEVAPSDWALVLLERLLEILARGGQPSILDGEKEVTTEQAAALLGVTRPTVLAMIERGELAARTVGRRHRRLLVRDVLAARGRQVPSLAGGLARGCQRRQERDQHLNAVREALAADETLTPTQLSECLGIPASTVRRYLRAMAGSTPPRPSTSTPIATAGGWPRTSTGPCSS